MQDKTRVVVLGAGYAGVEAAKQLHKAFKRDESVEITLIDKNPYHTLMTELHEVAGSRTEADSVQVSLAKIFAGKTVNVVIDEVKTIDFENNTVISEDNKYPYDYIIVGAGGEPEFFDVPGVQENSFTCWSLEDAIRIRTHVEDMFREAAKEPNPKRRRRLLTFAIAGGGFTGVELAGELIERREELCPKYHIAEEEVRIVIIEMMDSILPIFPDQLRRKAAQYIKKKGGEIMLNAPITKAEPGKITIADEESFEADTFIWTAGIHGSEFTSKIELTKGQCARGTETEASTVEGIHGMKGCYYEDDDRKPRLHATLQGGDGTYEVKSQLSTRFWTKVSVEVEKGEMRLIFNDRVVARGAAPDGHDRGRSVAGGRVRPRHRPGTPPDRSIRSRFDFPLETFVAYTPPLCPKLPRNVLPRLRDASVLGNGFGTGSVWPRGTPLLRPSRLRTPHGKQRSPPCRSHWKRFKA